MVFLLLAFNFRSILSIFYSKLRRAMIEGEIEEGYLGARPGLISEAIARLQR